MGWQNITKHDAHVLKFKMQFFPKGLFFFSIFAFFLMGLILGILLGQMYG